MKGKKNYFDLLINLLNLTPIRRLTDFAQTVTHFAFFGSWPGGVFMIFSSSSQF